MAPGFCSGLKWDPIPAAGTGPVLKAVLGPTGPGTKPGSQDRSPGPVLADCKESEALVPGPVPPGTILDSNHIPRRSPFKSPFYISPPPPPPRNSLKPCPWGGVRGGVTGKEVRSISYVQHAALLSADIDCRPLVMTSRGNNLCQCTCPTP